MTVHDQRVKDALWQFNEAVSLIGEIKDTGLSLALVKEIEVGYPKMLTALQEFADAVSDEQG